MRPFVGVLISAVILGSVVVRAQERGEIAKELVGRWEGEFQKETRDRFDNHRVLMIGGVEKEGDAYVLERVRFGGQNVNATLTLENRKPVIQFQSVAGNPVKLALEGEELVGMIALRGVAGRSQEVRPMHLKKVKG